jgi:hypothetical protein
MTRANRWIDRNLSRITLICVLGTCVCFVGLGYLNTRVSKSAADGAAARVTQCKVRPVTIRKENWFHASGVTSEAERQLVLRSLPSKAECAELLGR